uniref:Riboflavin kinase n=1 Tax=Bos indicus x Bos taurus TaxID=30522 RepID=A0A4W2FNE0_BOBOX
KGKGGKKHLGVSENSAFHSPEAEKNVSLPQIPTPGIHPRNGKAAIPHLRLGAGLRKPNGRRGALLEQCAQARGTRWAGVPPAPARLCRAPRPHPYLVPQSPASRSPDAASESSGTFCWVSGRETLAAACSPHRSAVGHPSARPPGGPAELPHVSPGWSGGQGTASTAAPPDSRSGPQPEPEADGVMRQLPYFCRGQVVRGFGRGSKQLGIPTANFPEQVVDNLPADISTGIYYGWASVGNGDVHKMVVSIGWNPYYKNTKKSMETHIMHTFKEDFYGEILKVAIVGYLRPEKNFDSLEALISAIQGDIEEAKKRLDLPEHLKLKEDKFFQVPKSKIMNGH